MSLDSATRALGSSFIDGSFSRARTGWVATTCLTAGKGSEKAQNQWAGRRCCTGRRAQPPIASRAMYAPHVLPVARGYHALYRSFRWQVPAQYNIGVDVCDKWAQSEPGRIAIFDVRGDGTVEEISYGALRETSNRL